MAASECRNAISLGLIINLQLTKKTATIVFVDDVTKSHFYCFFSRYNNIIATFYEVDTLKWNKDLIFALIYKLTKKFYTNFFDSRECMLLKIVDQKQTKTFLRRFSLAI